MRQLRPDGVGPKRRAWCRRVPPCARSLRLAPDASLGSATSRLCRRAGACPTTTGVRGALEPEDIPRSHHAPLPPRRGDAGAAGASAARG